MFDCHIELFINQTKPTNWGYCVVDNDEGETSFFNLTRLDWKRMYKALCAMHGYQPDIENKFKSLTFKWQNPANGFLAREIAVAQNT